MWTRIKEQHTHTNKQISTFHTCIIYIYIQYILCNISLQQVQKYSLSKLKLLFRKSNSTCRNLFDSFFFLTIFSFEFYAADMEKRRREKKNNYENERKMIEIKTHHYCIYCFIIPNNPS